MRPESPWGFQRLLTSKERLGPREAPPQHQQGWHGTLHMGPQFQVGLKRGLSRVRTIQKLKHHLFGSIFQSEEH